jgi:hypothetical protein
MGSGRPRARVVPLAHARRRRAESQPVWFVVLLVVLSVVFATAVALTAGLTPR